MTILQFPTKRPGKNRPIPAAPGDLIVGVLKTMAPDFGVLTVAEVDDEGAVSTCLDICGARVAVFRLFDVTASYFIAPAKQLSAKGRASLPGLCASDIEDIKAAFREHAEVAS